MSALGLIVLSPLLIVIATGVILDSGRPIFYRQTRVGLNSKRFRILKFRSMIVGADSQGSLTVKSDLRVTRLGRFLRRYKLDELPQLANVFVGEMSFVGPRPEVPEFVEHYTDEDKGIILSVRPGITDNASIVFIDENALLDEFEDPQSQYLENILPVKLSLYREYVANQSLRKDISIILNTIRNLWRTTPYKEDSHQS